ncbi:hypothetical protein ACFSGX_14050 [Sphingomonas arantia]|uniref:Uncharacterized protein n=1 Tax=Sphingomonas arantia TaxID=1460676 RepID=A0ABW4U205_9SPHN
MVPIKDYVDKADEAVESRLMAKLDGLPTKATIWGSAGALFLGTLAVLSFAGDRFDAGIGNADTRQAQLQRDQIQDAAAAANARKLDELLRRTPAPK